MMMLTASKTMARAGLAAARHCRLIKPVRVLASNPFLNSADLMGRKYLYTDSFAEPNPVNGANVVNGADSAIKKEKYKVPKRIHQKIVSASDAVELVRDGDTVAVSGFVCQGAPEAVLKALGERFERTSSPKNLTLFFGGGPGDYGEKGLSHLGREKEDGTCMLFRTIGGHYGQVPKVADLALANKVEAWTLPMGSVSRMIRAQSTHSPGHITTVGLGTYVDPEITGGAVNEKAAQSPFHSKLVSRINIDGEENLMYKALPIDVAIIRGTTADAQGNITLEHESLLCDQKIVAAAAKNSGGIVIAQVKRVAGSGTLPSRSVGVPGPMVDCVVVVDEKDHDELHPMSYLEKHNPVLTGEIKTGAEGVEPMEMGLRKLIARRAFFCVKPNKIVNLGIGLPEGVASVASEEGMLDYLTLSTEPGVFGGLPASGHSFGPAFNASSLMEMNQMFDFYDGGGLDMCFLGAAQISPEGDVNVSRMSKDRLTGPGGFIDISQSTRTVCFMTSLTAKGLKVETPGDGTLKIAKEGQVKKLVPKVMEKTFSGDEAVRRGQNVLYVTERCVFQRTAKAEKLELIEIAPGMDLQKDILDQMEFEPIISPNLKLMDTRIFNPDKMGVTSEIFGSLEDRCVYREHQHTLFIDLFGITLNEEEDVDWFYEGLQSIMHPLVENKGPIDIVANYDGFDIRKGLEEKYVEKLGILQKDYYKSVKRFSGHAFKRAQIKDSLRVDAFDADKLYDEFDTDHNGTLSLEELRAGFAEYFQLELTPSTLRNFVAGGEDDHEATISREKFRTGMDAVFHGA
ncbi:Caffeate CoA-transferase [Seminavis robusta]|uniref:Caffeate CoA-transferase n=1 Tax=Seminavis robusta TaxID=568900 RepID=A0A9N8DB92_9STRA|nr:Caffeate CoA-transferase [Seminavis robusta]|eukprot:Sro73_g040400.1 Caffeate CoA-transferase (797) ;mRNA; r:78343-81166